MYKSIFALFLLTSACTEPDQEDNKDPITSAAEVENGIWELTAESVDSEGICPYLPGDITDEILRMSVTTFGDKGIHIYLDGDYDLLGERQADGFWAEQVSEQDSYGDEEPSGPTILPEDAETSNGDEEEGEGNEDEYGSEMEDEDDYEEEYGHEMEYNSFEQSIAIKAKLEDAKKMSGTLTLIESELDEDQEVISQCRIMIDFTGLFTSETHSGESTESVEVSFETEEDE